MDSDSGSHGSMRFILSHAIQSLTISLMNSRDDVADIDTEVAYIDQLASPYTWKDKEYAKDLEGLQSRLAEEAAAKGLPGWQPGLNAVLDMRFRLGHLGAIMRSLVSQGILDFKDAPTTRWDPTKTRQKVSVAS